MLSVDDFAAFFEEVHGRQPFPWQNRLLVQIATTGGWPSVLDLPTGTGKTAAIDIAVFHLALEACRKEARQAPVRIAFVVDRRLVVDDAFERAKRLEIALRTADTTVGPITRRVANCLKALALDGPPLVARRLRGGIPQEGDWARTPSQPTVLCSTVDQVGSRLLFRGYGVSDSMKPVHAGLIGSDCLILLDEAHLAEPFRQTLSWIDFYRGPKWRESNMAGPWQISLLTATPGSKPQDAFRLNDEDKSHPILKRRLDASKPIRLVAPPERKNDKTPETDDEGVGDGNSKNLTHRVAAIVDEIRNAIHHFRDAANGVTVPAFGVVVNRVARARKVFEFFQLEFKRHIEVGSIGRPILMIGPARSVNREALTDYLKPIRTGATRQFERPLILIATQCIEAGVDIDLDALITEIAPLDALRQRFGRLNRDGRDIVPYGAVIATKSDISSRVDDPVYKGAGKRTWERLVEAAKKDAAEPIIEFGLNRFFIPTDSIDKDILSPRKDAPVLLPTHLDLLSQTSPAPLADPDVGIYLHGESCQPDSITVVWRGDITPDVGGADATRRLLIIAPPRPGETIELPISAVRRWLVSPDQTIDDLADAPAAFVSEESASRLYRHPMRAVFRWQGNNENSRWIEPSEHSPGDSIVVPATYGGIDEFGFNPGQKLAVDVALAAAWPFAAHRFTVRVAPGLIGNALDDDTLADTLANAESDSWRDLRDTLLKLPLPDELRKALVDLTSARRRGGKPLVVTYRDIYGIDEQGRPRGVAFLAPLGLELDTSGATSAAIMSNSTEDDWIGSLAAYPLSLKKHSLDVELKAERFAEAAGLPPDRIADLKLAGLLHDQGKRDARFQAWLHFSDPLGLDGDNEEHLLAKSARNFPPSNRSLAGLPDYWRHEALSVRYARAQATLPRTPDSDLVLWLIGSHHGFGRPLFPHQDPQEEAPEVGPQSLAFDWKGFDWPSLFIKLKARYGVWELARMEAILRLADHRASEDARDRSVKENDK